MTEEICSLDGYNFKVITLSAAVVGSGAAGFAAACNLVDNGITDIAIVSENRLYGTSRNTGSDKQTYYKLSLCGSSDSPSEMAQDLFNCGAMDGDTALAEAANSAVCFLRLCQLGVPFPTDRFGQYVGYRTDHDLRGRATSVGPLTSKLMTESLERASDKSGIRLLDHTLVIAILKNDDGVSGLLALDTDNLEDDSKRFVLINCPNIVFATGGAAHIYADNVYPDCHTGASGVLFESGAMFQNVTEWQYGLASIAPKWNVSGTYMQVLPRFVSVGQDGDESYFLEEHFAYGDCLDKVFLKGYEWPFDSKKLPAGSSLVDVLVYNECKNNRRVYLDFRQNPYGADIDYSKLSAQAYKYLTDCGACFGTPIDRLMLMNSPAYDLYLQKGVDLARQRLEIAVCAQHHNGGAAVDVWWQSSVRGLFVVGEAAGTHGIVRPGGSALNSGQVGAMRAARYISKHLRTALPVRRFVGQTAQALKKHISLARNAIGKQSNINALYRGLRKEMSEIGGVVRVAKDIRSALDRAAVQIADFDSLAKIASAAELPLLYKLRDNVYARTALLFALDDYISRNGKTRGSAVYPLDGDLLGFEYDADTFKRKIQQIALDSNGGMTAIWRDVRELELTKDSFENIWRSFRECGNIF